MYLLAAADLPWLDTALITAGIARLEGGDPQGAIDLFDRSMEYERTNSPSPMREGYRAVALAARSRMDEARACWEAVKESAFPALRRRVEAALAEPFKPPG